jgi:hypothetical protein
LSCRARLDPALKGRACGAQVGQIGRPSCGSARSSPCSEESETPKAGPAWEQASRSEARRTPSFRDRCGPNRNRYRSAARDDLEVVELHLQRDGPASIASAFAMPPDLVDQRLQLGPPSVRIPLGPQRTCFQRPPICGSDWRALAARRCLARSNNSSYADNSVLRVPHRHMTPTAASAVPWKVRGERVVPLRLDRRQPLPSGIPKGLGTAKRNPYRSYVNEVYEGAAGCPRHTSPGMVLRPTTSQG